MQKCPPKPNLHRSHLPVVLSHTFSSRLLTQLHSDSQNSPKNPGLHRLSPMINIWSTLKTFNNFLKSVKRVLLFSEAIWITLIFYICSQINNPSWKLFYISLIGAASMYFWSVSWSTNCPVYFSFFWSTNFFFWLTKNKFGRPKKKLVDQKHEKMVFGWPKKKLVDQKN